MVAAPLAIALAALPMVKKLLNKGFDFDVIDAHYFYPDGVAAALLGKWLNKPVVITARGTDLNLIAQFSLPRRMIRWAAGQAVASIAVSSALREILRGMGISEDKLHVMRNGVDLERFRPLNQLDQRRTLGLGQGPVLLSVGNLVEAKGHHLTIEALTAVRQRFPHAQLVIIGAGPERNALLQRSSELGVAAHVRLPGAIGQADLASWYCAADVSVLASVREGWANVLLESMACGTPVVATQVGGNSEVITNSIAGHLVDARSGVGLAAGILALLDRRTDRTAVRSYAERFSWTATTQAQLQLFGRFCKPLVGVLHA